MILVARFLQNTHFHIAFIAVQEAAQMQATGIAIALQYQNQTIASLSIKLLKERMPEGLEASILRSLKTSITQIHEHLVL